MTPAQLWVLFASLFVVLFVLCATVLGPRSIIDWLPGTTASEMFWGQLQANGPIWTFVSALGGAICTGIVALLSKLITRFSHNPKG